jgi:hypothetical protein
MGIAIAMETEPKAGNRGRKGGENRNGHGHKHKHGHGVGIGAEIGGERKWQWA